MEQDFSQAAGGPTLLQQRLAEAKAALIALEQAAAQAPSDPYLKASLAELRAKSAILKEVEKTVLLHLLPVHLKLTEAWIEGISDPEYPQAGLDLIASLREARCKDVINVEQKQTAVYTSFSLKPDARGFLNHIVYGSHAVEDEEKLFSARVHEALHALQKRRSAALHASPFNPDTKIIICPRDWLLLQERCEQDANAKQAWFNSILAISQEKVLKLSALDPVSARDFAEIRQSQGSLSAALVEAARIALNKQFYLDNPYYKFANHYHDYSLNGYVDGMNLRRSTGEAGFIFVRAEPEDIIAIGQSFGIASFGDSFLHSSLMWSAPLLAETQRTIAELNAKLGIVDEFSLPTLSQALYAQGMSRRDFIARTFGTAPSLQLPGQAAPSP